MVDTLALGLNHADMVVRRRSVEALQKTFVKEAAAPLIEALKDDDDRVVSAAKTALLRLSEYFDEKEKWETRFGIKKIK